jgi:hypothetical protein
MKRNFSKSIFKILIVVCLFVLGPVSGQRKKQTENTLFGKQIKPENINPKNGVIRCASAEYENFLQEKNPKRMTEGQFEAWAAPLVQKHIAMRTNSKSSGEVITIPVVVHVIHHGQAVGSAPNITDIQVQSQITVLNQDYGKIIGTSGYNTNPAGVDTQIQFVLAQQDPYGNPTNGIDRRSFCQESWSTTDIESTLKPATIWDPTQYLNLWSIEFTDSTLLGYAQFPDASGLSGLSGSGNANTDGVVVKYNAFGSGTGSSFLLNAPYNKGRTMTHEIGHWLGLIHIWGDGSNCTTNTDYCDDTPVAKEANYGCVSGTDSCTSKLGLDMIENYMDYTDDSCMNIFTQNQKDRMYAILNNAPRRNSLKTSAKGTSVLLLANDAEIKLESSCTVATCSSVPNQTIQNITIYNRGTSNLTSATLNYTINGGSNILYSWAGSLATNKFATFPITINSPSNRTITITADKVNGVSDQRTTNNSVSGSFIIPVAPPNFTFTNYIFRLQQDYYGSETTWSIKNAAGTILYEGGPYTDTYVNETTISPIPTLITQNWTLPSNQCYTFTIDDAAGDGICCGTNSGDSGTGYYDLKSTDGSTIITSGASFTSSESKSFTTNTILDTTKPTLTTVADRDENVDAKCEFSIPDYTLLTAAADNSETVTLTQSPSQGTIISGNGTVQLITLTALDSNGNSDFTTFSITLRENDIYLFPNPAKETINIITSYCVLPNSFSIYNSAGQMINQKEVETAIDLTINTSTLSSGIYSITIEKENEKKTLQFIKE